MPCCGVLAVWAVVQGVSMRSTALVSLIILCRHLNMFKLCSISQSGELLFGPRVLDRISAPLGKPVGRRSGLGSHGLFVFLVFSCSTRLAGTTTIRGCTGLLTHTVCICTHLNRDALQVPLFKRGAFCVSLQSSSMRSSRHSTR